MKNTSRMNIFGEDIDYTKYKDDIKETKNVQNLKGCHFKLSEDIDIHEKRFEPPRVKSIFRAKQNAPKAEFYDLKALDGLPMQGEKVSVYHNMMNQYIATSTLNNISPYIKFGACVIKFEDIPNWVNYKSLLDSLMDILRKTGRNSTILKCEGENDCILVQSKSFTSSIKDSVVEYVRSFIFTSKQASDYANVTINLENLVNGLDIEEFKSKVGGCVSRFSDTEKLVRKLESVKDDIVAFIRCGNSVGVEESLCSAIIAFARVFYNYDLSECSLQECLGFLNQNLPKSKKLDMAIKTGKIAIMAIIYIDKMLDAIEDFQVWGKEAC